MTTAGASSLEVEVGQSHDGPVVRLAGELDASTAPGLWARIEALEPDGDTTVLDLSGLDFVDSSGISCLFRIHQRVADGGGMVVARHPSPQIRRLLEMTQLSRVVAIID